MTVEDHGDHAAKEVGRDAAGKLVIRRDLAKAGLPILAGVGLEVKPPFILGPTTPAMLESFPVSVLNSNLFIHFFLLFLFHFIAQRHGPKSAWGYSGLRSRCKW